ncbi:zinc ABC transporter substrate-binding protein [Sinomonas notoginsengisoli]|uniref:metal ABC transporter solute-binding protein, Zn/Mn family n=1 Tax=Sinomonas notoginsengisoli TaxID=1457311 RepID=UPI001F2934A0|nr:zinc ABC transporter substrate-binding protein [Sinomonas notoginsengisoli]
MRSFTVPQARSRSRVLAALALTATLGLAACAPGSSSGSATSSSGGAIGIVASTNVYGDLAEEIGGDRVSVISLVSKASQDPHSYEATTQDRLAVSKAKIVIENGGGYDPFMDALVRESGQDTVITAVHAAGLESGSRGTGSAGAGGHPSYNEHVWYDVSAMKKVATAIADRLARLDPSGTADFDRRAKDVDTKLTALEDKVSQIKAHSADRSAAMTEPVPLYLLEAAGLKNVTPEAFTSAIEEGHDVPPAVLKEVLDLIGSKRVALLAYNPQTESSQTEQLRKAAEAAKVPVVDFTETVPEGMGYLDWMNSNVDALAKSLT